MQESQESRKLYVWVCAFVAAVALILLSGTMGFANNTGYGQISQSLADQVGVVSNGTLAGQPINDAWAVKPDAGFFINLPASVMITLGWLLFAGLLTTVALGVKERSLKMATLPGLVFLVASTMIGTIYFEVDSGQVLSHPAATVAIMVALGAIAVTALNRWRPAMIRRTPDQIPVDGASDEWAGAALQQADRIGN